MTALGYLSNSGEHLDLILATAEIGIWELDVASGQAIRNLRHDQIFGHDSFLPEWNAEVFFSYVHVSDRERVRERMLTAIAKGEPWSFEARIRRADGEDRWITAKGVPKFADNGKVDRLVGHVIDITETKANEDRLQLLAKELNHRVGNSLAILGSMVRQANRKAETVDEFAKTLLTRIEALARANRVLVAPEDNRSSFREILTLELEAFGEWAHRFQIVGNADLRFSPEVSEALTLIAHELLTNAVKHGSLSAPSGTVKLQIVERDGEETEILWSEHNGPPVKVERKMGIGSAVLQSALRDNGILTLDYRPDGLVCMMTLHQQARSLGSQDRS